MKDAGWKEDEDDFGLRKMNGMHDGERERPDSTLNIHVGSMREEESSNMVGGIQ